MQLFSQVSGFHLLQSVFPVFFPQTVPSIKKFLVVSFKLNTLYQNALKLHLFLNDRMI